MLHELDTDLSGDLSVQVSLPNNPVVWSRHDVRQEIISQYLETEPSSEDQFEEGDDELGLDADGDDGDDSNEDNEDDAQDNDQDNDPDDSELEDCAVSQLGEDE